MYYSFVSQSKQAVLAKKIVSISLPLWLCACLPHNNTVRAAPTTLVVKNSSPSQVSNNSYQFSSKTQAPPSDPFAANAAKAKNSPDLWQRITLGFNMGAHKGANLTSAAHARIDAQIQQLLKHPRHLYEVCDNARPYLYTVTELMEQAELPLELTLLPAIESSYQPYSFSSGEAAGLWQIIPSTARHLHLRKNEWYDGRRDVYAATKAAIKYLQQLRRQFDGDWLLALAAYNSGPGNIIRAQRSNAAAGLPTDYWNLKLSAETSNYIPKLLALAKIVDDPTRYGANLCAIDNHAQLLRVPIKAQLDLSIAAKLAETSLSELQRNNAALSKWATPPDGPNYLYINWQHAGSFAAREQQLRRNQRLLFVRHKIKAGDTLSQIAKKFNTSSASLRKYNNMHDSKLRAGKYLLIALDPNADLSAYAQMLTADGSKLAAAREYTVQAGDSWWSIAKRHKLSVAELKKSNPKHANSTLRPKDKLFIKPSAANGNNSQLRQQKINYKVKAGDNLSQLSQRFKVSQSDLRNWNKGKLGKYLKPGQQLLIYVDGGKI